MMFLRYLPVLSLLALSFASPPVNGALTPERASALSSALNQGQQLLMQKQIDQAYWNFPAYLGTNYISQYYLVSRLLRVSGSELNSAHLKQILASTQLPDGSWMAIVDRNLKSGDINTTILNYWALKAMGEPLSDSKMSKARDFILSRGGIEKSSLFTKIFLALFANYPWAEIPSIPYTLFLESSPLNYRDFAQWVGPHLMPIAYLREMRVQKEMGPLFKTDELWKNQRTIREFREDWDDAKQSDTFSTETLLVDKILSLQQPKGSWGGYTVSTLLTCVVLQHYTDTTRHNERKIAQAFDRGVQFIEWLYFDTGESSYKGVLDDGRYWDTALAGIAAAESGVPLDSLKRTAEFFVRNQTRSGGWAFGLDFEYAPDTDDTAEIVIFLSKFGSTYSRTIQRAVEWLESMQNDDGGWGAFDQNNTGNFLLNTLAGGFTDSADLFDDSSADVTAHILEALGTLGYNSRNSRTVRRAIQYLKKEQNREGAWLGRWGVNYLYATSAAVVGLLKAGEPVAAPYVTKALNWMRSKQNADGGFGETTYSYRDPRYAGVGVSTPTQTAWVLVALTDAALDRDPSATLAADYLMKTLARDGRWVDYSTVGTGHPDVIYMDYPSYPYTFTLTALARYARAVGLNR